MSTSSKPTAVAPPVASTPADLRALYDETYYERGVEAGVSGYSNYRWLPELTIPMAMTIIDALGIRRGERVLDFGCAKGYLVKALRVLGRQAFGVDISPYAIEHADPNAASHCELIQSIDRYSQGLSEASRFHFALAKDVLEHVPYEAIDGTLAALADRADSLLVVVPLGLRGRFIINAYERDVTHIVREPVGWWLDRLGAAYANVWWSHHVPGLKDNWHRVHPQGNAVFVAWNAPRAAGSTPDRVAPIVTSVSADPGVRRAA